MSLWSVWMIDPRFSWAGNGLQSVFFEEERNPLLFSVGARYLPFVKMSVLWNVMCWYHDEGARDPAKSGTVERPYGVYLVFPDVEEKDHMKKMEVLWILPRACRKRC